MASDDFETCKNQFWFLPLMLPGRNILYILVEHGYPWGKDNFDNRDWYLMRVKWPNFSL